MQDNRKVKGLLNLDLIIGISFILFTLILFLQTIGLPTDVVMFPQIILTFMVLTGCWLIFKSINKPVGNKKEYPIIFTRKTVIVSFSLLILYFLLNRLGFYFSLFLYVILLYLYIGRIWNLKTMIKGMIFSASLIMLLYFIFYVLMNLRTPKGILF